jgi:hypothetical protein
MQCELKGMELSSNWIEEYISGQEPHICQEQFWWGLILLIYLEAGEWLYF